eukprot:140174-Prymnesium_polylepis.1
MASGRRLCRVCARATSNRADIKHHTHRVCASVTSKPIRAAPPKIGPKMASGRRLCRVCARATSSRADIKHPTHRV